MYLETQLNQEKEKNEIMEKTLRIAIENEIICRKTYEKNENIKTNEIELSIERELKSLKNVEIQTDL